MAKKSKLRLILWIAGLGVLVMGTALIAIIILLGSTPEIQGKDNLLKLRLSGNVSDGPVEGSLYWSKSEIPLRGPDIAVMLQHASEDDRIGGLLLQLDNPTLSLASAQEIRKALEAMEKGNKPCTAWAKNYDNISWYLATACSKVVIHPEGAPQVLGLQVQTEHYAGTFEKIGVTADIERIGSYKSAPEAYSLDEPSEPSQEQLQSILADFHKSFVADTAAGRKKDISEVEALLNDPPLDAQSAVERGLVDEAQYLFETKKSLEGTFRKAKPYFQAIKNSWNRPKKEIAVLHVQGTIVDGLSQQPFGSGAMAGDRSLVAEITDLSKDKNTIAIVLRVNSPGGSAIASDSIWKAIQRARERKPVVVSMGSYAASGGYYISMPANYIFAEPGTLTGSIGIFGGKFSIDGLLDKAGVTHWNHSLTPYAGLNDLTRPYTPNERAKIQERLQHFYDSFITKAAQDRKMSKEDLHARAQGRVWTGSQALEQGLVDALGGLEDAIDKAIELSEYDGTVGRKIYPKDGVFWDLLWSPPKADPDAFMKMTGQRLPTALVNQLSEIMMLSQMMERDGVVAILPTRIEVR